MSYCRFSSDDYQCDVYAYEGFSGFTVFVASRRYVFEEALPPPLLGPGEVGTVDGRAWVKRALEVSKIVDRSRLEPIGLSRDGGEFVLEGPGECADFLEELRAEGYRVPQYAIDALREEERENG